MADKKVDKKAPAKATPAKATVAKKPVAVKAAKAPAKRAVARPVTRTAPRPAPEKKEREERQAAAAAPQPKPKAEPRPLPTAPAGEVPLIGTDGSVGSIALPAALTTTKSRAGVLYQALDTARSNAHLGSAATKNRARVKGGGAKPWRQKGTGRARAGSTRSPLWRHGGVVFGPNGRRYQRRIPEKMRREAFAEAFAARVGQGRVLVYEGLSFESDRPRTRTVVDWLGKLGDTGKALFVTPAVDEPTARAAANARAIGVRSVGALRTTDVLTHDTLIVRRDALEALASRAALNGTSSAAEGARTGAAAV
jgi:large subunit ribosomal protein L4